KAYVWNLRAANPPEAARTEAALAFSPNGKYLATANENAAQVEDLGSGVVVSRLLARDDALRTVAFSPDRQVVVTAGVDARVRVWDSTSGRRLRTLTGHERPVLSVAY